MAERLSGWVNSPGLNETGDSPIGPFTTPAAGEPHLPGAGPVPPMPPTARRRVPDVFSLLVGVLSAVVAGWALTGTALWTVVDGRWLLAATALLVGVLMLAGSLRPGRRDRD